MIEGSSPPTATVVLLADDALIAAVVRRVLADVNTSVHVHPRGDARATPAPAERPDLLLLDRAGIGDVGRRIRQLRRRWPTVGIVLLNAVDDADLAALLDAGADDAVLRDSPLLAARLHAHARRVRTLNAGLRRAVGDIVFDREDKRVWVAGAEVRMTPRELALLDCMFRNAHRPVGTTTLAEFVWGDHDAPRRRGIVEVYIGYLRRKLARSHSVMIRTVRGVGYRFDDRR